MNLNFFQNRLGFLVLIIVLSSFGAITQYLAYSDFYQLRFANDMILYNIISNVIIGWLFFIILKNS
jgi:hypothetical protein